MALYVATYEDIWPKMKHDRVFTHMWMWHGCWLWARECKVVRQKWRRCALRSCCMNSIKLYRWVPDGCPNTSIVSATTRTSRSSLQFVSRGQYKWYTCNTTITYRHQL